MLARGVCLRVVVAVGLLVLGARPGAATTFHTNTSPSALETRIRLPPTDTSLNINTTNYSGDPILTTYTWPDYTVANAIVMQFDLSLLPPGAVIHQATLHLTLVTSDQSLDPTYAVSVHKIVNRNPVIERATGETADGTTAWTPNGCCYNGVPLAQADISPLYDQQLLDKNPGDKSWTVTPMVQEWLQNPSSNFGLLLNSDATKPRDRFRYFASVEASPVNARPFLEIAYTLPAEPDTNPPDPSIVFESDWDTAVGTSTAAITDGGKWPNYWEFNRGATVQLLAVVQDPSGVAGRNALRVQQRGSSYAANIQLDDFVAPSQDFYLRFYMMNDDTSGSADHVATVDTWKYSNLTYLRKSSGANDWRSTMSMYGCGEHYPLNHWSPPVRLVRGVWYRFEYFVHFVDPTHIQVHPRVYDANGSLLYADADFRQQDYKSGGTWNGRDDWTLASYYEAGYSFCVDPTFVNDFALGNNGQYGAIDTGAFWYFAAVQIRTDTWPGPASR